MKILYLTIHSESGGSQRYIYDLTSHFKDNHEVLVAFGESRIDSWLSTRLSQNNIKTISIPSLKIKASFLDDIKAIFQIRKIIKDFKPKVVHLNTTKISVLGAIASRLFLLRPKIVYTAHGWAFNEKLGKSKISFIKFLERCSSRFKDKIICVSYHDKACAIEIGINEEKIKIVHNGISEISFKKRNIARQELLKTLNNENINHDDYIIGTIGKLQRNKGYGYLLNSIKRLINNNYKLKLVIIGEGEEMEKLENIIKKENLDKNVFLAGYIEKASSILKAFDIYINSSINEGLSYTIIEALYIGMPIVVTDIGGNIEIIEDGINGVVAKTRNPEDIADKISYLMDNKNKAELFSMNNIQKLQYFNLDKMLEKTENVYHSLTQK